MSLLLFGSRPPSWIAMRTSSTCLHSFFGRRLLYSCNWTSFNAYAIRIVLGGDAHPALQPQELSVLN